ncbi:MAG: DNA alkylation repair protein [Desulfobacterales bacterium]|nr:DNA alkylation repair protein [Desulfobacterales bacterium]
MTAQAIRKKLKTLGSKQIATSSRRFFKTGPGEYGEGDIFIGVRVPVLRKLIKDYLDLPIKEIKLLLQSAIHEERLFALLLLVRISSKADEAEKKSIYELYLKSTAYINNWDLVDTSAEHIVGGYLKDKNRTPLYRLAKSTDLWERRIAIMATFHFIKHHDFSDTLRTAKILLSDRHDLIHKAVGWMLREIGNSDLAAEENFLQKHYEKMPRTMLRYAIEKFPEAKRQRYLKGEI